MIINELVSKLGFDITGEENLRRFNDGMDKGARNGETFARRLAQAGKTAAGFAVALKAAAAGSMLLASNAARPLDELAKQADRIGVTVEALQELGFAAEQSGSSQQELGAGLESLATRLAEAARGQGRAKVALEAYGISATDAAGNIRQADDVLVELADTFQRLDREERLDLANKLGLSRGMVTMLSQGNDELDRQRKIARDAGFIFGEEAANKARDFNDSLNLLNRTITGIRHTIGLALIPSVMQVVEGLQSWLQANRALISSTISDFLGRLNRNLQTLSNLVSQIPTSWFWAMAAAFAAIAALAMPLKAAIVAVALAIDDIFSYLRGEDSLVGAMVEWLQDATGASQGLAEALVAVGAALAVIAMLKPIALFKGLAAAIGAAGAGAATVAAGAKAGVAGGLLAGAARGARFARFLGPAGAAIGAAGMAYESYGLYRDIQDFRGTRIGSRFHAQSESLDPASVASRMAAQRAWQMNNDVTINQTINGITGTPTDVGQAARTGVNDALRGLTVNGGSAVAP